LIELKQDWQKYSLQRCCLIFSPDAAVGVRVMELAHRYDLPAVYDAHYLALAEREGCDYWTADKRLWNSVKGMVPWVRWLGDYHPAG
jgi:predicted nucleic acid-binding protein